MPVATPKDEREPARRFVPALLAVLALGLASQWAILAEALARNPFAWTPVNDARVYWDWAGEIARGTLVGSTPFLSAPLYPYLLGIVRALGGDLAAVYVIQALLHVATAAILFRIGAKRFTPAVGLVAAALFLLIGDPAHATGRILPSSVQVILVALLWDRMIAFEEAPRRGRTIAVGTAGAVGAVGALGALLGLNVLANPVMLAAVPIVAWWAGRIAGARIGIAAAAVALVLVVPATVHNRIACGELVPVSAQAGVTFYHGNAPGADGTYHPIEGISADRIKQNVDARAIAARETDGSWGAASSFFFRKGLAWWRAEPVAAAQLLLRKLHWFVAGRSYGDIYVPALEVESGFASRLRLAPIPVAWLTLPALVVLFEMRRRRAKCFPEALLLLVPLVTVAIFWYSPRYRMPAVPVLCVLSASAVASVLGRRSGAPAIAIVAGVALTLAARQYGLDDPATYRAQYEQSLGTVLVEQGRIDEAVEHYQSALELGHPDAGPALGDVWRRLGDVDGALRILRDAVERSPGSAYAHRSLGVALAQHGDLAEAQRELEAALAIDPRDWEALSGLGNVLLAQGSPEAAIERYEAALRLNPGFASAHHNLGCALEVLGRLDEAERAFRAALALDPDLAAAARHLELLRSRKPGG